MPQLAQFCIWAKPAAASVCEFINRRKQPCLTAELLCVLFCITVLVQQGYLVSAEPQQPFLLVFCNADILHCISREALLVLYDRPQLAVPLNSASPTDRERAQQPFLWPTGDPPGKQTHIRLFCAKHPHLYPHTFQRRYRHTIDKCPVFRYFSGYVLVKHDLTINRFIKRLLMADRQQDSRNAVLTKGAGGNISHLSPSVLPFFLLGDGLP